MPSEKLRTTETWYSQDLKAMSCDRKYHSINIQFNPLPLMILFLSTFNNHELFCTHNRLNTCCIICTMFLLTRHFVASRSWHGVVFEELLALPWCFLCETCWFCRARSTRQTSWHLDFWHVWHCMVVLLKMKSPPKFWMATITTILKMCWTSCFGFCERNKGICCTSLYGILWTFQRFMLDVGSASAGLFCLGLCYPDTLGECHHLQLAAEVLGSNEATWGGLKGFCLFRIIGVTFSLHVLLFLHVKGL